MAHDEAYNSFRRKNIVYYGLSPFQQRAFPNLTKELAKEVKRFGLFVLKAAPFVVGSYMLINWANKDNKRRHRKNPADYLPGANSSGQH